MEKKKIDLTAKKCKPCNGDTPALTPEVAENMKHWLGRDWSITKYKSISKVYKFKDFHKAMQFVNKVAELSEEQGHHPDIGIRYNKVTITLTTHAIKGLSENDFILAAKIDTIYE